MQKLEIDKDRRRRLVAEIDARVLDRLQAERIVTGKPANAIVEEVLSRYFEGKPTVTIGQHPGATC